ncbi:MAG: hypothetical protein H6R33_3 [Actinobacteria bacterium]|nr:hypothetical protein [Actinomycetota bacterium]
MRSAARWAAPILVALAVAACSGGAGGDDGEAHWIVSLLQRIPGMAPGTIEVSVADLPAAAAAAGITVPPAGADDEAVADYLLGLPRDVLVPDLLRDPAPRFGDLTRELGIDPSRVLQAITAGTAPETYQALRGDFDAAAIDAAVRADPVWSDLLATADYRDVGYYTWGEDFATNLDRVTPVRPLGRGGRLGLDGQFLYWAPWTAGMEGLIDAGAGAVASLADDLSLARAARALEEAGVYSATLTDRPLGPDAEVSALALGVGGGRDETGAFWAMVAVHNSGAAAEEAAAAVRSILGEGAIASLGRPWSERISGFTVTVDGDLLVAVMHSSGAEGDWMRAYQTREPVVLAAQT